MPVLRSDDSARKLRAVWLGPTGASLPFEWTYTRWAATLAAIPTTYLLLHALVLLVGVDDATATMVGLVFGPYLGIAVVGKVTAGVSFDQPLRYRLQVARAELSRRTPAPVAQSWEVTAPACQWVSVRLSRELGWVMFGALS